LLFSGGNIDKMIDPFVCRKRPDAIYRNAKLSLGKKISNNEITVDEVIINTV
jgi:hypothetical protein